ncbi:hypothetical protein [Sorangium sp. So ce1153]|uniref:hypothetical protein n=1 Tax=Sorangium sp. So ce1153 TaxID=3133333 RepID=UPI003F5F5112
MSSHIDLFSLLSEELDRDSDLSGDIEAAARVRLEHQAIAELRQAVSELVDPAPVVYTVA